MSTIRLPPLPSWKCHKVVQAAKILRLDAGLHGNVECLLDAGAEHDAHQITLPSWWVGKHSPEVGGYIVQYDDGYASYSPAAAFEAGYTQQPQADASIPPHQARVIDERAELAERIDKLAEFTKGAIYAALDPAERMRLAAQLMHMVCYRGVLNERIAAFTA